MSFLLMEYITKLYGEKENLIKALDNVSLKIDKGEFIAIMGPSGSGKTTLLNILGCLDKPTQGEYILDNTIIRKTSINELAKIRNKKIGFIFQQFALLQQYTTYQNIELPLIYSNLFKGNKSKLNFKARREMINKALLELNMEKYKDKCPSQMSGGEQQRVAIARALICNPEIILADEPTGSLDKKTGSDTMNLLKQINKKGKTIIVVTHDQYVASYCQRTIFIEDGRILN